MAKCFLTILVMTIQSLIKELRVMVDLLVLFIDLELEREILMKFGKNQVLHHRDLITDPSKLMISKELKQEKVK